MKKMYPARVLFVLDASRYEALLSLDFGIFAKKVLRLVNTEDFPKGGSGDHKELESFRAAKKVAMELALGKKCYAEVEETRKYLWTSIFIVGEVIPEVEHREIEGDVCFNLGEAIKATKSSGYDSLSVVNDEC